MGRRGMSVSVFISVNVYILMRNTFSIQIIKIMILVLFWSTMTIISVCNDCLTQKEKKQYLDFYGHIQENKISTLICVFRCQKSTTESF